MRLINLLPILHAGLIMKNTLFKKHPLAAAVSVISAMLISGVNYAQENEIDSDTVAPPNLRPNIEIEEVVVTARLKDSTTAIIRERMEQAYSAEILGIDQITKAGDSNVASALRRVTGLTLVDGKFVYVRGLGERYSSTTLNGAAVPSPQLTRNVVPLDLFPTSILDSVKVHKAYSADQPAAFGGGNIDIRTKGVPEEALLTISFGSGWDSNTSGDSLKIQGDGGGLPGPISNALQNYQGNIGVNNILAIDINDGRIPSSADRAQAEAVNRELITALNRNADFNEGSADQDFGGSIAAGNSWYLTDDLQFGVLANYESKTEVRNEDRFEREFNDPEGTFADTQRTVEEEKTTSALNFGFTYQDKHFIETNSFILENNEDETSISEGFDLNFTVDDGRQRLGYSSRLEKRELKVNQIIGEHLLENGDFGFLPIPKPFEGIDVRWIYSDATVNTEIPNETSIQAQNIIDPTTLAVLDTRLRSNSASTAEYKFLELEDQQESYGVHFDAPFSTENFYGSVNGGFLNTQKAREYYGYTANLGVGGLSSTSILSGLPRDALTDSTLTNLDNDFELTMGSGFGTESYLAAQTIDAGYGGFDVTWKDTWRLTAGVRYEQFMQAVLPVDLLDYQGILINSQVQALQNPDEAVSLLGILDEEDYYPSVALTYLGDELFGSDSYQIRFGVGMSAVRPDLREKADVTYIDPESGERIRGNPNLVSSDVTHVDLRMELFYPSGSNVTASLFYKDLDQPIETVREPLGGDGASGLLTFENGVSAEVYGIEFEGFTDLWAGFFLTGNLTLSDSETNIDLAGLTNPSRPLTGHSDIVTNLQLGYDSPEGMHSASLVYNYFSERVYVGNLNGDPDEYDQPFHSLDLVYTFYPTYNLTLKAKVKNMLGEDVQRDMDSVTTFLQEKGTSFSFDMKYDF